MRPRGHKPRGKKFSSIYTGCPLAIVMVSQKSISGGEEALARFLEEGVSIRDLRDAGRTSTVSLYSIGALIVWAACWRTFVLEVSAWA